MAHLRTLLGVTFLCFAAVGCVSSEKYATVKMDADQYATRLAVVEREKAEAIATRDALQHQIDTMGMGTGQKDALVLNQANQISELQRQLGELNQKYADAASRVGTSIQLPEQLNDALKQFAAANADTVTFDEPRGIVKFKSDVLFAPGSAVLTSSAAAAIDRFATIVNSPAVAAGYELTVVGHTDNIPVSHPATRAAGHKDNWYLSAHRAISVKEELVKQSVSPSRLEVAGCADQRPSAPNTDAAGRALNRRVEVLILPMSGHSNVAAAPSPMPVMSAAAPAVPAGHTIHATELNKDLNKDAPPEPRRPVFNK